MGGLRSRSCPELFYLRFFPQSNWEKYDEGQSRRLD
jgi:hypothetical protein